MIDAELVIISQRMLSTQDRRRRHAGSVTGLCADHAELVTRMGLIRAESVTYTDTTYRIRQIRSAVRSCGNLIDRRSTILDHRLALERAGLSTMCPWVT